VTTQLVLGVVAGLVALAMLCVEVAGLHWFTLRLAPGCALPLWSLLAVYAALQFTLWRSDKRRLDLSEDEVARWGAQLEQVTPTILSMYGDKVPVREIATALQASHGIPPGVTLRYIIALARHVRDHHDARPPK